MGRQPPKPVATASRQQERRSLVGAVRLLAGERDSTSAAQYDRRMALPRVWQIGTGDDARPFAGGWFFEHHVAAVGSGSGGR